MSAVANAQESQPGSQPVSASQALPVMPASAPEAPIEPREAGAFGVYAHAHLQAMMLFLYFNAGIEGGVGLRVKQKAAPSSSGTTYLGIEGNAHSQGSVLAFGGDATARYGGDLSVRWMTEQKTRKPRRIVQGRGTAVRLGLGAEGIERNNSSEGTQDSAVAGYGVLSSDAYLVMASALRVGMGAAIYGGATFEAAPKGTAFVTFNLFELGLSF